jgi:hypothetical protein
MFWRGGASLVGQQIWQTVMRARISPCDGAVLSRLAPYRRRWQYGFGFPGIAAGRDDGG